MDEIEDYEEYDDQPRYQPASAIDQSALRGALCKLHLIGDDPFLRMQAFNLAIVDQWLTGLEYQVLQKLVDEERTPLPEAAFLSAQSQMWIFAAIKAIRSKQSRL